MEDGIRLGTPFRGRVKFVVGQAEEVGVATSRKGELEFGPIDPAEFMQLVRKHSFSEETGSNLSSQYEAELSNSAERVGVLGFHSCGRLVGAISYAHTELPFRPSFYEARLDVVVTLPHCRGLGIGALLMSGLFLHSIEELGERLVHYSTIALHPSVVKFVSHFGFSGISEWQAPLYSLEIDEGNRSAFAAGAREEYDKRLRRLKLQCIKCMHKSWSTPWCVPDPRENLDA